MKKIIYIHWWTVFPDNDTFCKVLEKRDYSPYQQEKKKRKDRLANELKSDYEFFRPDMPNKYNANYKAWKIWFEKSFQYFNDEDLVLIWHSLWWMFLIKYIWENWFSKKIKQLHLVSAVFDESDMDEDEKYSWDFAYSPDIISNLEKYCDQIFIYHSTDDDIVPYSHAQKIKSYLPNAKLITFKDRWHFFKEETFPEILENILNS